MKKLRDLDNRKNRNILEFKINEIMIESVKILERDRQFPALKALNSFSPRLSSFTVSVRGKRSIDPFLKLLDSFGKSIEML